MSFDFNPFYSSHPNYYGLKPSQGLSEFLESCSLKTGKALDLGCGQGRDSIYLAQVGFTVLSLDSSSVGIESLVRVATEMHLDIECRAQDIALYEFPRETFDIVIASTILDHLKYEDLINVTQGIIRTLKLGGFAYILIFTTDDIGYVQKQEGIEDSENQPSETSAAIQHYFAPNELCELFKEAKVVQYLETKFLSTSHGDPHWHSIGRGIFEKKKRSSLPL